MKSSTQFLLFAVAGALSAGANAATIYSAGVSPTVSSDLVFGSHLIAGPHTSVAGVGGGGLAATGNVLDGSRTYIYDQGGATDLGDGIANRGDAGFAMMIWDMGSAYDSMRLYTHQDHYNGGPITAPFTAQDVMEYSVWGSQNCDDFVLLSDVTAFDINGGAPLYTFGGTEASVIYRGGSTEFGILNAYTREYVFSTAYRYYGVRVSSVSIRANDSDPELDAIAAFRSVDRCTVDPNDPSCRPPTGVPAPAGVGLLAFALLGLGVARRRA